MYVNKYSLKQILLTESKYQQAIGEFTEAFVQYYLENPRRPLPKSKAQLPRSLKSSYNTATSEEPVRLRGTTLDKGLAHLSHIKELIEDKFGGAAVRSVVRMDEPGMKKKYGLVGQEDLRIELDDPNGTVILISSKAGGSGAGKSNRTPTSVGLFTEESLEQVNTKLREALATPAKLESMINLPGGSTQWPDIYNAMMEHTGEDTKEKAVLAMFEGAGSGTVTGGKISKDDDALRTLSSALTTYFGIKGKDALIDILRNLNGPALIDKIVGDMFKTYYPSLSRLVQAESNITEKLKKIRDGLNSIQNYYAVKDSGILSMTDPDIGVHANLYAGLKLIAAGEEVFVLDTSTTEKLNRTMYICVGDVPMLKISVRKSQTSTFRINAATADIPSAGTLIPPGTRVEMDGIAEVGDDLEIEIEDEVIETSAESDDSTEALELVGRIKEIAAALQRIQDLESGKSERRSLTTKGALKLANFYQGQGQNIKISPKGHVKALYEEILGIPAGDLGAQAARDITKALVNAKWMDYLSTPKVGNVKLSRNKHGYKPGTNPPEPRTLNDFIDKVFEIHASLNEAKNDSESIINERWSRLAGLL